MVERLPFKQDVLGSNPSRPTKINEFKMTLNILFNRDKEIPDDLAIFIKDLKKLSGKEECLKKTYEMLTKKYYGKKLRTFINFFDLFICDIGKLWRKSGFMHCTNLNYLAKFILIKSGHFKEEDIQTKWTLIYWISPHQYLRVRTSDDEYIDVDIWANSYGIDFGDYARGFNV